MLLAAPAGAYLISCRVQLRYLSAVAAVVKEILVFVTCFHQSFLERIGSQFPLQRLACRGDRLTATYIRSHVE
jgi:hypothetical protein